MRWRVGAGYQVRMWGWRVGPCANLAGFERAAMAPYMVIADASGVAASWCVRLWGVGTAVSALSIEIVGWYRHVCVFRVLTGAVGVLA